MSHILFINPPNAPFTSTGILIEPIDLLGLASWTQNLGYKCTILDMDVKALLASDLDRLLTNIPDIMVIVFDYHIPLHDVGANQQIKNICSWARARGCKTILGGKAASFWNEVQLERFNADIYVSFDMEYPLKELLEAPWTSENLSQIAGIRYFLDGQFHENKRLDKKIDLNNLPISDRSLIDLSPYIDVRTLLSSRGCNLQCSFCHVPGFWGWWRGRAASVVADEIEILVSQFNAKKILFLDDNAMVKPQRMQEIAQHLLDRDIKTTLGCLGTIDKYDPHVLELMQKAGWRWIHYGAESGDEQQLIEMGKRITPQKIKESVSGTKSLGMRVRTSWILDMPETTLSALKKTEELILSIESQEIRLHFLTLRLGSILHKELNIETPQFIHNGQQNFNISGLDADMIEASTQRILEGLVAQGYTVVRNADEFKDIKALQEINPELKIVSLCPLRYGLGWAR